jgi:VCBS repeat-containing protein
VATGVTVSSSGGAHTSGHESESVTSSRPVDSQPLEDVDVETPPESSGPTAPVEVVEPSAPSTPPTNPATEVESDTGSTKSAPVEHDSNSSRPGIDAAPMRPISADEVKTVAEPSSSSTESAAAPAAQALTTNSTGNALTTQTAATAITPTAPTARVAAPATGLVGFLNGIVTNLLNPFLAPAPSTQEPLTPVIWAVLGWVRREIFNQAPTLTYNPSTTVQTGQTITGKLGATDPEGDPLTYEVTRGPRYGTLTIDQATGTFTYTPDDIDYTAEQLDSFTIAVTDGKFNLLSLLSPHSDQETIGVSVLNPTVERVILDLPAGYTNPDNPRFAADGKSLYFGVTPPGGTRVEVHQINVDGTNLRCVTCGLSPNITAGLTRVVPAPDGRIMIQVETAPNSYVVYEPVGNQLVPVITPPAAARVLDPQREMRISPDGKYVVFSQVQLGQTGNFTAVPVVGRLVRTTNALTGAAEYQIEDARVIFPVGEAKQWTPDGRGVIITGGQYEMGNVDNVLVDLATGAVTRLTANLDYDEDIDMSPNGQWIAVGSTRTYDALTPMTRIVRPPFLPAQIQGAVYEAYRGSGSWTNVSNQEWLVAIEDELKGENGIPLFVDDDPNTPEDEGDDYNARSMASWNATGDAVAFWEAQAAPLGSPSPGVSRLVVANLKYTTSVGPVEGDLVTPHPTWAPKLSESVPTTVALPPVGIHPGAGGGTATITEVPDPANAGATLRTVTYVDYVNVDGLILNGSESTSATASQNTIRYTADITVTGAHTGYLRGDVTIDKLMRTVTPAVAGTNTPGNPGSMIRSSLDGDLLVLLDPNRIAETRTNA